MTMATHTALARASTVSPSQIQMRALREKRATVRLVEATQLEDHLESWRGLAKEAITPNPFYEPWTLLSALGHLRDQGDLRFLLVVGPANKNGTEALWGFFPLELQSKCLRLPVRTVAFWQHRYCFLAAPLVDRRHVYEVLDSFWRWFEQNPLGCNVLDTNYLPADGPFHQIWSDFTIGRSLHVLNEHPRAFQAPAQTIDSYIAGLFSPDRRSENVRKERRLRELGAVEYQLLDNLEGVDAWLDEFIRLEAAGWKGGPEGDAFAKQAADCAYLRAIIRAGFEEKRVSLLSLRLDGRAIAMRSVFISGCDAFAFKSTYDEAFSKYSPGLLLVLEHLRRLFGERGIERMDTCTAPRHPMHDATASERRIIRRSIISSGTRRGDFLVSLIPLLRWVKNQLRPNAGPSYLRVSTRTVRSEN
jgi:CelD/BcsL family acetyltransferase involved in cellulose biosynthesis